MSALLMQNTGSSEQVYLLLRELRGIPDRRGIGPFLQRSRTLFWYSGLQRHRVIERVARRGNLQHPHVIECALCWIKIRICPVCRQLFCTNAVFVAGSIQVDGIANRSQIALGVQFPLT